MKDMYPKDDTNNQINKSISELYRINESLNKSSDLRFSLSCLAGRLEHSILQNERINLKYLIYYIIRHTLYKIECSNLSSEGNTIYLWPIQYLHCDFLSLVAKGFEEKKIKHRIIIIREGLVQYMKNKGHEVTKVKYNRALRKPFSMARELSCLLRYFVEIFFKNNGIKHKKAFLILLYYLEQPLMGKTASEVLIRIEQKQYHIVGYDLSAVGWAIIKQAKLRGLPTGRIQNGAPNYHLAGYSEVDDLFLWDKYSAKAYANNGFKGRTIISGNVLLQNSINKGYYEKWKEDIKSSFNHYKVKIFVAFSGPGHNTSISGHLASLKELMKIVTRFNNYLFLIKLHPKDDDKYYIPFKNLQNVIFTDSLNNKPDALSLIQACDAIITGASAVSLDALQLNKIVFSIDPLHELTHFEFLKDESVINTNKFTEEKDMLECIEKSIDQGVSKINSINIDGVNIIIEVIINKLNVINLQ